MALTMLLALLARLLRFSVPLAVVGAASKRLHAMDHNALWNLVCIEDWLAADRLLKECSDEDSRRIMAFRYVQGSTVLHICATLGAPASTVRAILRASPQGAINAQTEEGCTAAMEAAGYGRARVLAQLMKAGANMGIRNVNGGTARDTAVHCNRPAAIAVLDAYDTVFTLAMCLDHYDKIHVQQCLEVSATELHKDIIVLRRMGKMGKKQKNRRFKNPSTSLQVSGFTLHELYGHEKGVMRIIFSFLLGENYEDDPLTETQEDGLQKARASLT